VGWPYLLEGRIPTDWIEESRAQVTNGDEEPPRPQYSTQTSAPYYKTQDYTYTYEDDE
jgi:hypothetical protein